MDKYRDKLEWVARNMLRIKYFNFTSPSPYREQIDSTVDYIINSIDETLEGTDDVESSL